MRVKIEKEEIRCDNHPDAPAMPCAVCGKELCSICGDTLVGTLCGRYCPSHSLGEIFHAKSKIYGWTECPTCGIPIAMTDIGARDEETIKKLEKEIKLSKKTLAERVHRMPFDPDEEVG